MSFLRLLSPTRANSHNASPPTSPGRSSLRLALHVPSFGVIFMNPLDPLADGPTDDVIFSGELEVKVPPGAAKRCQRVEVHLEARRTDMDRERRREKGCVVCFELKTEIHGGTQGILLQPGSQRFEFTLIVPLCMARHGDHELGHLRYWLVATIEGRAATAPLQTSSHVSSPLSKASPRSLDHLTTNSGGSSMSIPIPSYCESVTEESEEEWLSGSIQVERRISIAHNPNMLGGVNEFDDHFVQDLPSFGSCEVRVRVNEWCVSCLFPLRLWCLGLSPRATLFALRIRLRATAVVTPPTTGKSVTTTTYFNILEHGKIPPAGREHPGQETPALWRGTEAGGRDKGDYKVELLGKLPDCMQIRPTTLPGAKLPGVTIPIRDSHTVIYELFYSVHGERADGQRMALPGHGELRAMKRTLDVVLPSCVLISNIIGLPSCFVESLRRRQDVSDRGRINANLPCPICHLSPLRNLCTSCPRNTAPHVKHDKPMGDPEKKSFDPGSQACPLCAGQSVLPSEAPLHHLCACEIDGREPLYAVKWEEGEDEEERTAMKEEAERGRPINSER